MNRVLQILSVVAVASFLSVNADAADPFRTSSDGAVSSSALSAMGLGGMKQVSNVEASKVRGQGAISFGVSRVNFRFFGSTATDTRVNFATGNFVAGTASLSTAGVIGGPVIFAGGFGIAGGF